MRRHLELKTPERALEAALLLGLGLLWPLPLPGAVLMVAAGFGLAVVWESELGEPVVTPALIEPTPER